MWSKFKPTGFTLVLAILAFLIAMWMMCIYSNHNGAPPSSVLDLLRGLVIILASLVGITITAIVLLTILICLLIGGYASFSYARKRRATPIFWTVIKNIGVTLVLILLFSWIFVTYPILWALLRLVPTFVWMLLLLTAALAAASKSYGISTSFKKSFQSIGKRVALVSAFILAFIILGGLKLIPNHVRIEAGLPPIQAPRVLLPEEKRWILAWTMPAAKGRASKDESFSARITKKDDMVFAIVAYSEGGKKAFLTWNKGVSERGVYRDEYDNHGEWVLKERNPDLYQGSCWFRHDNGEVSEVSMMLYAKK